MTSRRLVDADDSTVMKQLASRLAVWHYQDFYERLFGNSPAASRADTGNGCARNPGPSLQEIRNGPKPL